MSLVKKINQFPNIEHKKEVPLDISRFVKSTLFNEVFVLRDIEKEMKTHFENEENSGFLEFWSRFCDFAINLNKNLKVANSLNAEETKKQLILPIMDLLGYGEFSNKNLNHYVEFCNIDFPTKSGDLKNTKTPVLICRSSSDKELFIKGKERKNYTQDLKDVIVVPLVYEYFDSWADMRISKYSENKSKKGIGSDHSDSFSHLEMGSRCAEYLRLMNKEFGIATDGVRWRIVHSERTFEDSEIYYEFDLIQFVEMLSDTNLKDIESTKEYAQIAKWFFWFFSKKGLIGDGLSFVSEVELRSKKYADDIEEDLKTRFVHAVTICTNGFNNRGSKVSTVDLDLAVKTSESFIFNLFFLRSCESKGAIPFHQGYKKISLANIINKISNYVPRLSWKENSLQLDSLKTVLGLGIKGDGHELFDHCHELFTIIRDGKNGFGVQGFIETIFYDKEYDFFKSHKLENETMVHLLHELMFFKDGNILKQIPYRNFSPRQLGTIYESFLEFKPFKASSKMFYVKSKTNKSVSWQWIVESKIPKKLQKEELYSVEKGEYFFSPNNEDRKMTGAYYTPQYLVKYVVANCLGSITKDLKSHEDILKLKVCDPSMGSGHFLVEVLSFLTSEYKRLSPQYYDEAKIKRDILEACIYGSDINPSAIKLGKMSLWLASAFEGSKLEKLDDQLIDSDSLMKLNWKKVFPTVFAGGGFDAVVGNPPWEKLKPSDLEFFKRHQTDYGSLNFEEQEGVKVKVLKDKKRALEYTNYLETQKEVLSALANSEKYCNQVFTVNGKKVGGDANTYKLFIELAFNISKNNGEIGFVLPMSLMADAGSTGLRNLIVNNCTLGKVISFKNNVNDDVVFDGVEPNQQICICIFKKGGHTEKYLSKNILTKKELYSIGDYVAVNHKEISEVVKEYSNFLAFNKEIDLQINLKLNKIDAFSSEKSFSAKFKDGEAHMTSKKKYFKSVKNKWPLITGKQFSMFSSISDVEKYVDPDFSTTVSDSKSERIVIKAILPNSKKKLQSTIVPKGSILSNNLMTIKPEVKNINESLVIMAILNSSVIEYRFRYFLSNFRMTQVCLAHLPIDKEIVKKLNTPKVVNLIEKLRVNGNDDKLYKKLDEEISRAYDLTENEILRIHEYIYEA